MKLYSLKTWDHRTHKKDAGHWPSVHPALGEERWQLLCCPSVWRWGLTIELTISPQIKTMIYYSRNNFSRPRLEWGVRGLGPCNYNHEISSLLTVLPVSQPRTDISLSNDKLGGATLTDLTVSFWSLHTRQSPLSTHYRPPAPPGPPGSPGSPGSPGPAGWLITGPWRIIWSNPISQDNVLLDT